jgi:hypothetical protein
LSARSSMYNLSLTRGWSSTWICHVQKRVQYHRYQLSMLPEHNSTCNQDTWFELKYYQETQRINERHDVNVLRAPGLEWAPISKERRGHGSFDVKERRGHGSFDVKERRGHGSFDVKERQRALSRKYGISFPPFDVTTNQLWISSWNVLHVYQAPYKCFTDILLWSANPV